MTLVPKFNFKPRTSIDELADLLEETYLKQRREDEEITKKTFAPSAIGGYQGTCARYWYLAFDGANFVQKHPPAALATMQNGIDAHKRLQGLFKDAGILIDEEIEVELSDPPIRGYMDVMIDWKGEQIPGEIKTTRQEAFTYRVLTRKPNPQHLLQILVYMRWAGKKKGFLLYENNNTREFIIIPVVMSEENELILEDCFDWMRTVRQAWEAQTIPKAPYQKRNKICQSCPLLEACSAAPVGELKIPAYGRHKSD